MAGPRLSLSAYKAEGLGLAGDMALPTSNASANISNTLCKQVHPRSSDAQGSFLPVINAKDRR